jgi:hypothetical protein
LLVLHFLSRYKVGQRGQFVLGLNTVPALGTDDGLTAVSRPDVQAVLAMRTG